MSKRIANKKGKSRKTPARSHVKFGWKVNKRREELNKLKEAAQAALEKTI